MIRERNAGIAPSTTPARRRTARLATLAAAIAALVLLALPAAASAEGWEFKEKLGEAEGSEPSFVKPVALAVDPASGDLLVVDVEAKTISRFQPNGAPHDFSALGTNVIDGKRGPGGHTRAECETAPEPASCDETPQNGLDFGFGNPRETQVAVDRSCDLQEPPLTGSACTTFDPAYGDIYVTQPRHSHNLIDIFSEGGKYLGQLTESSEGLFGVTTGVAVDPSGAVYVSDLTHGKVHKCVPVANPVANANCTENFSRATAATLAAGAGSTSGSIFADKFGSEPVKLDSSNGAQQCVVSTGESLALAVNPANGHLFSAGESAVQEYEGSCASEPETPLNEIALGGGIKGVAVDGASRLLYLSHEGVSTIAVWAEQGSKPIVETTAAEALETEGATLTGTVNPNGEAVTSCRFEYLSKEEREERGNHFEETNTLPCAEYETPLGSHEWQPLSDPPTQLGEGEAPIPVRSTLGGLLPGTKYFFQLAAANANNAPGEYVEGGIESLITLGPAIRAEFASAVGEEAATVAAEINPRGEPTSYQVQYVTEASYGESQWAEATSFPATPEAIGEGTEFAPASQHLTGLAPGTEYRFRFVAHNANAAHGTGGRFTTYPTTPEALPDDRAWEKVSPTSKLGEVIPPNALGDLGGTCIECAPGENSATMPMQSTPGGDSVLYLGQPFATGLAFGPNEYVSGRSAAGWDWQSLSPGAVTGRWQAFSADLSRGVLFQEEPPLSPLAPSRGGHGFADLYLREAGGTLTPLIEAEPPNRSPGALDFSNELRIRYSAANAGAESSGAFTHIAFEANDSLTGEVPGIAPEAPDPGAGQECTGGGACELYEWSGEQLHLVNVLPDNETPVGEAAIGSGRLLNQTGAEFELPNTSNAVSEDGRFVFFSSAETGHVYARVDNAETLTLSGPATCEESPSPAACFLTASTDGHRALLGNGQIDELNEAGTEYEEGPDLTAGQGGFQGILGAADDLSRVYFVDTKPLSGAEENASHEAAQEGKNNLFAWHEGEVRFIGRLTSKDGSFGVNGRYGAWRASPSDRTAQVSADGRFLAFVSQAPLTGYENDHAGGGGCSQGNLDPACFEVFEYAADTNTLACASCNPSGQPPIGGSNLSLLAPKGISPPFPQPGNLSRDGEGRLFFESQDTLSPHDTNGHIQDVYEWEPVGVGDCTEASPAYHAPNGGCLALISSGHSPVDSFFLDSSHSGDDAFFITRARLVPADKDSQLDLYDARAPHVPGEAVGFAEEAESEGCKSTGACQGEGASAPSLPGAASAAFDGPGNPKPKPRCAKGKVRRGGKCVKKHKKHHKKQHKHKKHKRHHRRANHDRRAHR